MTMARRQFLSALAAVGATTAVGGAPLGAAGEPARTVPPPTPRGKYGKPVIDLHFHWYPKEFIDLLEAEGGANGALVSHGKNGELVVQAPIYKRGFTGEEIVLRPTPGGDFGGGSRFGDKLKTDVGAMLQDMDEAGIDLDVCSQTNPHVLWAPPAFGLKLAQAVNDGTSKLHQQHPARFLGTITLPLQDVTLSLQELERARALPGMRAVNIIENVRGRNLGDESFWPIWERCEQLGLPLFLKNVDTVSERLEDRGASQMNIISNPLEATIAATSLMLSGALDAFPTLEVYLPHAGGFFAFVVPRIDYAVTHGNAKAKMKQATASAYLRRFHYDLILHSPQLTRVLVDLVGVDRVACGTDRPQAMGILKPVEYVEAIPGITRREAEMILCENPARLLRI